MHELKKKLSLLILVLSLVVASAEAWDQTLIDYEQPMATHDILLDAVSWKSFPIMCIAGDTLSGEFELTSNGDLFIGDQTKYDNWLLTGITFLILDESNFDLWINDQPAEPLFEREGVNILTWTVKIPSDGIWYVVYFNDSIFMKQVEGSIQNISQNGFTLGVTLIGLIGLSSLLMASFFLWKKK